MLLRRPMLLLLLLLHMVGREAQQTTRELVMHLLLLLLLLQLLQVVDLPRSQLLLQLFATANHTVAQAKRAFDAILQLTHTLLLLVLVVATLLQHLQQVVAA
jgi:hypothetical protein